MRQYTAEIWRYRYFWGSLVRMDIRNRYQGTILGLGWSILQPLAMAIVIGLAFSTLFGRPLTTFLPYLIAGQTIWQYLTNCTVAGSRCLVTSEPFLRQVPAPMAIYPLRTMLAALFHLGVASLIVILANSLLAGFAPLVEEGASFSLVGALTTFLQAAWQDPTMILVGLLSLSLFALFGWATVVVVGFAHAYFPDVNYLVEVGMRMLFYLTPIIYTPDMMYSRGVGWVVDLNPMASLVAVYRMPLLGRGFPELWQYGVALILVFGMTGMAVAVLYRLEQKVIFQL